MGKLCWVFNFLLLALVGTMAYLFMIKGSVVASDDGRSAIVLTAGERDMVLGEMREFLVAVQAITKGIVDKDMKAIYAAGHKSGMAAAGGVPTSLMGKLPLEFKQLGMATHKGFDGLALEAQDIGDERTVLAKLGELLNNCTTCHASYRMDVQGSGK